MPPPMPGAPGHTFHINLNLSLGSQELDGQHGNSLAVSLATFLGEMLHPNKKCRVLASPGISFPGDSDDGIEQQDPSVVTLANHLSGLTTTETVAAPPTDTTIAVDGVPRATAADNDASLIVTSIPVTPMAIDVGATNTMTGMEPAGADVQVLVAAMIQRAEPPPSTTETPEDAMLLAAVTETGAAPPTVPVPAAV